jgi:CheY-like chemotaxis protein
MHSFWNSDLVSEYCLIKSPLDLLVAEDDPGDMMLLQRTCKRLRWVRTMALVSDGQDVLDYLQGQGQFSNRANIPLPDILILDQRMPKLSGLEVLAWIRTEPHFCGLPVVLLSTELLPKDARVLSTLQGAYCEKSVDFSEMATALHESVVKARSLTGANWYPHGQPELVDAMLQA